MGEHCFSWLWADSCCRTLCSCLLFFCVCVHFISFGSSCPNVCLASLFSLAIHCLTAEVFFQPLGSCPLKFSAHDDQVIVMSGHETIRVLEVEVDSSVTSSGSDLKGESGGEDGGNLNSEAAEGGAQGGSIPSHDAGDGALRDQEAAVPAVQTIAGSVPVTMSLPQMQTPMPFSVQACPQVLTQEGLATLMTGMIAQPGSLGQPLLIPLSMAGSVGGQGGLAVLTFTTAAVAALPGLAAASPAAGLLKLPFSGLQASTVLNTVQPQLHTPAQTLFQPQAAALQSVQTAVQSALATPSVSSATTAQISGASLGAQPQFISSLTTTPIITNAMSNMAGLTGQVITNAQGQVIGTLPLLVNPAALGSGATTPALPTQGLQVQAMSPQLVLNTQGQIIGTIGNGPTQVSTSTSVLPKPVVPLALTKPATQGPVVTVAQSTVVLASQTPTMKSATSLSTTGSISCGEAPTVSQLVSKPQQCLSNEEGINLEEIREFAKNFKIRRLSLGLTQTQVGQALTATEGPAYSQSAICRFEKLDITPKSAQKLKPVLERWLAEAELWNQKGQQNLMEFVGGEPSKKRKRRTSFTPQAIEVLNAYFEKNALPTGQEITEIAKELNYDREVVRVWFCNRRQTLKNTSKINVFQVQQ
ncbi:POU domain, class 6, transcription factor 1 isoform X2 [Denticeps clupeoides]|uniref:POU domain, class 6, transcription factor 1 isoform X2 n=1 Tax=Denticeps clupeoides TaxID=299321 RepID=UPI0010A54808|nr:POU domain, class 6, transcription factor 1 isoform X2 [Denticeps clupeoides]